MQLTRMLHLARLVVVASVASATLAHAESQFIGTVLNAETKQPIGDVVVSAISPDLQVKYPGLSQGEVVVVTDAQGRYRIPQLTPGVYTLRFEKEAFKPFSLPDLQLRLDRTLRVNVELLVEPYQAELTVRSCRVPIVDVTSSTLNQFVERDLIQRLPVKGRSFEALAELVPGTRRELEGISIQGASPLENGYVVDGLSTQDLVSGFNASPLNVEFLWPAEVVTGSYMPEYGRATGGVLRVETQSGYSSFHGTLFGSWSPGFLAALPMPVQPSLQHQGDLGAALAGPLIKERLWFFAGVAPSLTRYQYTSGSGNPQVPGDLGSSLLEQRGLQAMGKLTYQVASGQEASLSVITLPTYSGVWGSSPPQVDPDTGAPDSTRVGGTDRNVTMTGLHYSGVFLNHRLRVSAHLGSSHQQLSAESSPQGLREGGARYQGVAQASWWMELAGHHELKAGVDGDLVALERSVEGRYASRLLGGFVQDSWMPFNRLTVNAGVRYESQWLYGEDDQLAFALAHQLFPRVGLVLDPFATSHMKLFAHYGKYHAQVPLALMPSAEIRYSGARQAQAYNPAVLPPPSTELVAGAEFELLDPDTRLSAHYTHRQLAPALEGNPEEERTLDAVTVVLSSHNRWQGWQAQASYTWAHLYGNYVGPFREGEMEFPSDFDLSSLMENRTGLLPYDRTHTFKAFGAKEFNLSQELSASVGLVYRGSSGRPISYRGAHVDAGVGESFILPRGMAGRTDWHNVIDSRVGVSYRLNQDSTVSFTLDVFNLFNFQAATGVDEDFTYKAVLPIKSGTVADLTPDAEGNIEKLRVLTDEGTRAFNVEADMNRNFGRPTQYQAPRQMRVGLRYTF